VAGIEYDTRLAHFRLSGECQFNDWCLVLAAPHSIFNVQRHLASAGTHRAFKASALHVARSRRLGVSPDAPETCYVFRLATWQSLGEETIDD
jgi:hypothetical protein